MSHVVSDPALDEITRWHPRGSGENDSSDNAYKDIINDLFCMYGAEGDYSSDWSTVDASLPALPPDFRTVVRKNNEDGGAMRIYMYDGAAWQALAPAISPVFGTPVTVGTANDAGSGTDFARSNHVHEREHAAVTTLTHTALTGKNDETDIKHLTDAQQSALHPAVTTLTHTALTGKNSEADIKHLTDAQQTALHPLYVHPTSDGNIHVPATGATLQILQHASAGTAKWVTLSGDLVVADGGAITVASTHAGSAHHTAYLNSDVETYLGSTIAGAAIAGADKIIFRDFSNGDALAIDSVVELNGILDHNTLTGIDGGDIKHVTASEQGDFHALFVPAAVTAHTDVSDAGSGIIISAAERTALHPVVTDLDHDGLTNWTNNKHIDHSLVSMGAGTGLSGGGNITSSRNFNLNLQELSTVTPVDGDYLAGNDASSGATQRATMTSWRTNVLDSFYIGNVVEDTTPQLGAELDLNAFTASVNASTLDDHESAGLSIVLTAASSGVTLGDAVYITGAGEIARADADAEATTPAIGIAMETKTSAACKVLIYGLFRDDSWAWTDGGEAGLVYISTTGTAGNTMTQAQPSGSTDQVQIIGHAVSADLLLVMPSPVTVQVA